MPNNESSILVASEDKNIREMARASANQEGYEAVLCGDGKEALESAKTMSSTSIRLIILEAFLPKLDGYEVAKRLQEIPQTEEIPILMLIDRNYKTGNHVRTPTRMDVAQSKTKIRLNADDYLQKPFEASEIKAQIHSMTKHFRKHKAPHPITSLPGHIHLEHQVFSRLSKGETLGMICMDINHFRPFNDQYGTDKGNEVLHMTVKMIQDMIKSHKFPSEMSPYLSHVDGDDFLLLIPLDMASDFRKKLRQKFQTEVAKFYSKEDVKKGFFKGKDRSQKDQIFPIMTLSTAVLEIKTEKYAHCGELVSEVNELLRQSKVGSTDVQ